MSDQQQLPEFEGIIPVGVLTSLTGTSQRIHRPIHHGDRGVLVVEYEVADIAHPKTADGVKRKQVLKASDLYELDVDEGKELLTRKRREYREANGEPELPLDEGLEVNVDGASGVVMTPSDVAERLGDEDAVFLGDAEAIEELEQGRGRCGHILVGGRVCQRTPEHKGRHSERPDEPQGDGTPE